MPVRWRVTSSKLHRRLDIVMIHQQTENPSARSTRLTGSSPFTIIGTARELQWDSWLSGATFSRSRASGFDDVVSSVERAQRANDNRSGVLVKRTTSVPPDRDFAAVVEQTCDGWSHLAGTTARMAIEVLQSEDARVRGEAHRFG